MRFKIKNKLRRRDYKRLAEFLQDNPSLLIELCPGLDLEFAYIDPVTVSAENSGFKIDSRIYLGQSIGFEVYENAKLDDEMGRALAVNRKDFRISKVARKPCDLERDLNKILGAIKRIVNQTCILFDKKIEQTITLNPEAVDVQMERILKRKELGKRGEISRPFGTIHAKSSKDVKERGGGLIPLYKEYDKTYLYADKKVYFLLPHDFVVKLLRCDRSTMLREEEFDERGKEVLIDLVYKKYLKKRETLGGIICYYGLNEETRRYLTKYVEHRTSRL